MRRWAFVFLIIALVAAVFGFTDVAAASADIAKIIFAIFRVIFLGALTLGVMAARRIQNAVVAFSRAGARSPSSTRPCRAESGSSTACRRRSPRS